MNHSMVPVSEIPVLGQKFEFVDFEPSPNLAARAMENLRRLFGASPSDSSTQAVLRKTRGGFSGSLHIRSAVANFLADSGGTDPDEVLENLSREVDSQIHAWKERRRLLEEAP